MSNHNWVELRMIPLTAEATEGGKVNFYSSPEAVEVADNDTHILCWDCKAEPTLEEFFEPCKGAPSAEQMRTW